MHENILIPAELHEARLIIEALHKYLEADHIGADYEVEGIIRRIMSHIGYPTAKKIVPEAYETYYPDGPPKIRPWW